MNTNTIQKHTFPDGGFVLHRVTLGDHRSHYSAWYDSAGDLKDAEQITGGLKISRPVKMHGPAWRMLADIGGRSHGPSPTVASI